MIEFQKDTEHTLSVKKGGFINDYNVCETSVVDTYCTLLDAVGEEVADKFFYEACADIFLYGLGYQTISKNKVVQRAVERVGHKQDEGKAAYARRCEQNAKNGEQGGRPEIERDWGKAKQLLDSGKYTQKQVAEMYECDVKTLMKHTKQVDTEPTFN